jgi:aspartate-semialdehyde dehydrogenase
VGYNEEELKLVKETKKIWGVRARAVLAPARRDLV